jgi:uncharacterized protein involved in exopolysaccharide biosynthesis
VSATKQRATYDTDFDSHVSTAATKHSKVGRSDSGLAALSRALVRSWPWILGLTLVGGVAGVLIAGTLPKRYFAEAVILIQPQRNPLDPTGPVPAASAEVVRSQIEVLRSRQVIDRVITMLRLGSDPEFIFDNPYSADPADAIREEIAKRVSVETDGRSFAIKIGFEAESAAKAARIADAFAAAYLAEQREQKQRASDAGLVGLQNRLEQLRQDVFAAEQAAETFRRQNGLVSLASASDGGDEGGSMSPTARELSEVARQKAQVSTLKVQAEARARLAT